MATLEKILYPSNKFAFGVYAVVFAFLAIVFAVGVVRPEHVICAGLGVILGWTAHIMMARRPPQHHAPEFIYYENTLKVAALQLDQARTVL